MKQELQISLALIRLSTGIFFLIWSVEKLISLEVTQKITEIERAAEVFSRIESETGTISVLVYNYELRTKFTIPKYQHHL